MKKSDLKAGNWYKFFPYEGNFEHVWFFKCRIDGEHGEYYEGETPVPYVDSHVKSMQAAGHFSGNDMKQGIFLATPEEINQYLPEDQKIFINPEMY